MQAPACLPPPVTADTVHLEVGFTPTPVRIGPLSPPVAPVTLAAPFC
jgi:hypothetical protein